MTTEISIDKQDEIDKGSRALADRMNPTIEHTGFAAPEAMADYVPQAVHNFTGTPREIWKLTAQATGPACRPVDQMIDKPLSIRHVYIQVIKDFEGANGEVKDALRTVLIDKDGECYSTMSIVIAQEAFNMLKSFGNMPFDPPVDLKVVQSQTRGKTRMFSIVPI